MKLGFVGLGRMGSNMAARLLRQGHHLVVYDVDEDKVRALEKMGAEGVGSVEGILQRLEKPAIVWMMLPAGPVVDLTIEALKPELLPGDVLVDAGNSHFEDTLRRAQSLRQGVSLVDVGTSGGLLGARQGASLTIGGGEEVVGFLDPLFRSLSAPGGYAHVGPEGAGHFAKMVHNGIEYALLEAYAEGFELLRTGPYSMDLKAVAEAWVNGSVVRSWLLELARDALSEDPELSAFKGPIGGGDTGRWTIDQSLKGQTPVPLMYIALAKRYASRSEKERSFSARVVSALRNAFGGHAVGGD